MRSLKTPTSRTWQLNICEGQGRRVKGGCQCFVQVSGNSQVDAADPLPLGPLSTQHAFSCSSSLHISLSPLPHSCPGRNLTMRLFKPWTEGKKTKHERKPMPRKGSMQTVTITEKLEIPVIFLFHSLSSWLCLWWGLTVRVKEIFFPLCVSVGCWWHMGKL